MFFLSQHQLVLLTLLCQCPQWLQLGPTPQLWTQRWRPVLGRYQHWSLLHQPETRTWLLATMQREARRVYGRVHWSVETEHDGDRKIVVTRLFQQVAIGRGPTLAYAAAVILLRTWEFELRRAHLDTLRSQRLRYCIQGARASAVALVFAAIAPVLAACAEPGVRILEVAAAPTAWVCEGVIVPDAITDVVDAVALTCVPFDGSGAGALDGSGVE
jgi:hypothetical protein